MQQKKHFLVQVKTGIIVEEIRTAMKRKKTTLILIGIACAAILAVCVKKYYLPTPYGRMLESGLREQFYLLRSGGQPHEDQISSADITDHYRLEYANAMDPLNLITYAGNRQICHPKVLFIEEGFAGHAYWMAYTPYPWYIEEFENPCIACSDDGYTWTNINGNPIDDPRGDGYDSDTHLVYREDTGELECWYRYVSNTAALPVHEVLCYRTSKDGVHWSDEIIALDSAGEIFSHYLSPALIWTGKEYMIWVVCIENGEYAIDQYTYNGTDEPVFVRRTQLEYYEEETGIHHTPWHLDVIEDNGRYVFLVMAKNPSGDRHWVLFLTESEDLVSFSTPKVVMRGAQHGWDNNMYRSSIVKTDSEYRIYYSAMNWRGVHGLGVSVSDHLGDFVGYGRVKP